MIIITGASDGLGLQLAKLYKESGMKVVNISRSKSDFADIDVLCDLRKPEEIKQATKKISEIDENLDIIVNCAAIIRQKTLSETTPEDIDTVFDTNVRSQMLLIAGLYDRIVDDETDIVNVSSTTGTKGRKMESIYGSSKWAVRGYTMNLQAEFAELPNRVISFCPGGYKTRFFEKGTGIDNTKDGSQWMKVEDIARFMKQILDLPKNMEVSEVIINRKAIK
jgi:NADP-dependent 3-hydroxy acid dehydrogenase YdfG